MIIKRQAGYIYFSFQKEDWGIPNNAVYRAIVEIKHVFPHATPQNNYQGWSYDIMTKQWSIPDTPENIAQLTILVNKYLPPCKEQLNLF